MQAHREVKSYSESFNMSVLRIRYDPRVQLQRPLLPCGIMPVRWVGAKHRGLGLRSLDFSMVMRAREGF